MRGLIDVIRDLYPNQDRIALHEPALHGNEQVYTQQAIESTFVSSVGAFVDRFEAELADYTGAERAVAVVNGTSALHVALHSVGVSADDLVITQAFSFVATANAIRYTGADPLFIDIERETLGLDPDKLQDFLNSECSVTNEGRCLHHPSQRLIKACVPMHTFGHPCRIDRIKTLCDMWGIVLIEDAAESMGSTFQGQHTGTFGVIGAVSFNGNKIITAGAGGALLTDNQRGLELKHLTTTAKEQHAWGFRHDRLGFNYRMPNLNAALACAQLEQLGWFVEAKRAVARRYQEACEGLGIGFVTEPAGARSNYWLNAILVDSRTERDRWLETMHESGVMARPGWDPLHTLPMYSGCVRGELPHTDDIFSRLINLPSSANASRAE